MQPEDMLKLCFQAAYGAEHLLDDAIQAKAYFDAEFASVTQGSTQLYEQISHDCCRVNLFGWKQRGLPSEWLFNLFAGAHQKPCGTSGQFERLLDEADALCRTGALPFSYSLWQSAVAAYRQSGGALHHSPEYRASEQPAYRLVCARFLRLFPLLERLAALPAKSCAQVIALDGRAASGKTTLAEQLAIVIGAGVVHMDDFFLPQMLRTPSRLAEPGGNVHYERFAREALPKLNSGAAFEYRRFDCAKMDYGEPRTVEASLWRVVEGAYSLHPHFGGYTDLRVFCTVDPDEQLLRVTRRNGSAAAKNFFERWIPMEECYFKAHRIAESASIIL